MRDDNKKTILIITAIVMGIILILGVLYFTVFNKKDKKNEIKENTVVVKRETKIGYVDCSDNSVPLNVRNSINGSIINTMACGSKIEIINTNLGKTDNCESWYEINYKNTTGYVCGDYISKSDTSDTVKEVNLNDDLMNTAKELHDKADAYFAKISYLTSDFCEVEDEEPLELENGNVYKKSTKYHSMREIKAYLGEFLSESYMSKYLKETDLDSYNGYSEKYIEKNGYMYCLSKTKDKQIDYLTGIYELTPIKVEDNAITFYEEYKIIPAVNTLSKECQTAISKYIKSGTKFDQKLCDGYETYTTRFIIEKESDSWKIFQY